MSFDYAIHSDFLIHWTGKDIDDDFDSKWWKSDKSETIGNVTDMYIDRLLDILRYGLWMTKEKDKETIGFSKKPKRIRIPKTPRTCFTELKLSESRKHARNYGRLGIGVKRLFLFNRSGRPLIYYGNHEKPDDDIFLKKCVQELTDTNLLNFFKPMHSAPKKTKNYDFYSESEWRILYFEKLLEDKLIVDPGDPQNSIEHAYYKKLITDKKETPEYLIPLDGWLAMIIYPSLDVKNEAQKDDGKKGKKIREAIKRIKELPDEGNRIERGNWPVEVALDDCRNF